MKTFNDLKTGDKIYCVDDDFNMFCGILYNIKDHNFGCKELVIFVNNNYLNYVVSIQSMKRCLIDYGWFILASCVEGILEFAEKPYGVSKDL